jgi:glycosyltransferase involved in cell wall biosynthesis
MMRQQNLLIIWSGYRKYNSHFFQRLNSDCNCNIRIIWIRNHRNDDPPSEEFKKKIPSKVIGARTIRVSGYRIDTLYRLISTIYKDALWADCILTSTHSPFHSKIAYFYSKLLNRKIFIIIEQWKKLKNKSYLYRIYEGLGYHMMRNCNTLFVHGDNQKEFALENNVNPRKIRILPFLSDDLSKLPITKPDLASALSIDNKVVILYFGRITPRKGLKNLLNAYKTIESEIPDAILLVCGGADQYFQGYEEDAIYEKECNKIAEQLGSRIILTGAIDPDDKQNYIAISDIFVHPHTTHGDLYEGWGLVINEVTSMSLPVITTDRVGAAKNLVVDGKNGFVIPAGNIELLAEHIKAMVNNQLLRDDFSKNSRSVFENYHKPGNITNEIMQAMSND